MNQLDMSTPQGIMLGLLPEVMLTAWSLIVLLVASWQHETAEDSRLSGWLSFVGVVLSAAGVAWLWLNDVGPVGIAQMVALDPFRYAALAISLLSAGGDDPAFAWVFGARAPPGAGVLPAHSPRDRRHDVPERS